MPVRLGMLGVSHSHASGNARGAAMVEEVELVVVSDADPQLAQRRAVEWRGLLPDLTVAPDPMGLLSRDDIQGIIVDGAVTENLQLARLALENGKHVLLEKPAGTDLEELSRLHELAVARSLRLQMGYIMRYNAGFQLVRQLHTAGALGEVFSIRGRISWEGSGYRQQMPKIADLPGGMLFELGCHYLDLIMILLGKPVAYRAMLGSHHDPEGRYVDNAIGLLEYSGAFALIETSAMESGALQNRAFEVYGTRGSAVVQPFEPPAIVVHLEKAWGDLDSGWQSVPLQPVPRHVRDLQEFAACIEGRKEPEFALGHDLAVQEVLLGMCSDGG